MAKIVLHFYLRRCKPIHQKTNYFPNQLSRHQKVQLAIIWPQPIISLRVSTIETMKSGFQCVILLLACWIGIQSSRADNTPAFDLTGPTVDVHVARDGKTLPISQVANLAPGDRLWIHPVFPESQSAHYVLIVAFLRGSTNPPPEDWFTRVETWKKEVHEEGTFVIVPKEAQQALIFLAPETGGDFSTLRTAVRGRPGTFVRATQDLHQASYDRMRLEKYLAEVRWVSDNASKDLHDRSILLARSLSIKIDQQCFDKPTDQQVPCLMQNSDGIVLDDAHTQSMVSQWANGASVDLMNQLSYSQLAGSGVYSAYVGAVVDLARIMGSVHTAQYQYIPALALAQKDSLNLRLNTPPSFRNPKSVLVIPLPPVQKTQIPPLKPVDGNHVFCAKKPDLVLSTDGAPLVFATDIAHDIVLHVPTKDGKFLDLPAKADPLEGGFVVDQSALKPDMVEPEFSATLEGKWGFDSFTGPKFQLSSPHPFTLTVASTDKTALVVGREDTLHLSADSLACISSVDLKGSDFQSQSLNWKAGKSGSFEVTMPLKDARPGQVTLQVSQYGLDKPDEIKLNAYAEAAHLDSLTLNSGDTSATLKGTRLDEVAGVEISQIHFAPADLHRVNEQDELSLKTTNPTDTLKPTQKLTAHISLNDGRVLDQSTVIGAPRPKVTLLSKGPQADQTTTTSPIHMGKPDDLPENGKLVFFLKTEVPAVFPRSEKIEVAAEDDSFHTTLSLADGTLVLQDAQTALGILDPEKNFGGSAFGPLRLRAVDAMGFTSEWIPLGTLVRLPALKELRCPRSTAKPCALNGTNLFLVTAVASNPAFEDAMEVPLGFTGGTLTVPHPVGGSLYLKLRDDPTGVQTVTMPITPIAPVVPVAAPTAAPSSAPGPATPPASAPAPSPAPVPGPAPASASTSTQQ
jgi:hypothetical protein